MALKAHTVIIEERYTIKLSLCLIKHHNMKAYEGVEV